MRAAWAVVAVGLVILVGCLGCGTGAASSPDEPVRLVIWDTFGGAEGEAAQRVYDAFVASHPKVEIEREILEGEEADLERVETALASGMGPDVLAYDVGRGFRDVLAHDRLLVALNELPVRYGWTDRLDEAALQWTRRAGRLYGLPVQLELLGLYVNRTLLDEAWLALPDTVPELLDFCRQARDKGYVPIAVGADPGEQGIDLFAMALNNLIGPDLTGNLLFADWSSWDTVRVARAIRLVFVEMPGAGCYAGEGEAGPDAATLFADGRALLLPAGTGHVGDVAASAPAGGIEIVPFPTVEGGRGRVLPTEVGAAYALAAKSAHPREAAMLLDFVVSEEAARIWVEQGQMVPPVEVEVGDWQVAPLVAEALDLAGRARERPTWRRGSADFGFAIGAAAPEGFEAAMRDGFRAVMTGEKTPEEQATDLEVAWEAGKQE